MNKWTDTYYYPGCAIPMSDVLCDRTGIEAWIPRSQWSDVRRFGHDVYHF